jgi:hypothetical protein
MTANIDNRPRKTLDGREFIQYDGYWIRFYEPPEDSYRARRDLIDALTRRTFHHSEPGINTPGFRLELARQHYETQTDPEKKRVNAAMLAGALFNRATDIFTSIVEMEEKGIRISRDTELLKECGRCFREALELGTMVRHVSGEEGVDEMWGEPFKVFTLPIKDYYESRYIKIAQTMRTIDDVSSQMVEVFSTLPDFPGIAPRIMEFADIAKRYTEMMKADPDFFFIWPEFVVCGERLLAYIPDADEYDTGMFQRPLYLHACKLLAGGKDLINHVAGIRVPMRKSTATYLSHLDDFRAAIAHP